MKKAHIKILQQINKTIPKEYTSNLMHEVDQYAETKRLIDLAVAEEGLDPEKKESLENLKLSGFLDTKTSMEVNPEIERKIYEYIMKEVEKKVASKELPKSILKENVVKKTKQQNKHE